ncbi:MAG: YdcH family protein [Janthinobacterium lividum]
MEAQAMTIEARIRELGSKHRSLDDHIQREMRRPTADPTQLRALKQQKLKLKEQISALESPPH